MRAPIDHPPARRAPRLGHVRRRLGGCFLVPMARTAPRRRVSAVYIIHRVLPLAREQSGAPPRRALRAAAALTARAARSAAHRAGRVALTVPSTPDADLLGLASNRGGSTGSATSDAVVGRLHDEPRCDRRTALLG